MLKYMCQCLNVSFETLPSSSNLVFDANKRDVLLKSIESSLSSDNNEKIDFLNNHFKNDTFYIETESSDCIDLMAHNHPDFFSSNLKIKYPLLIGYSIQANKTSELTFKLNKCLICNSLTHILVVTKRETTSLTNPDNISTNTNSHTSSHSSANLLEPSELRGSSNNLYNVYLLVNTDQMKLVNNIDALKKSENYSHLYEIIFEENKKESTELDSIFGFELQIKMESEIGKKIFLKRIEDLNIERACNNDNNKTNDIPFSNHIEEVFKQKFLNLVNSLLSENSVVTKTTERKKSSKESNKTRRANRYENENILSSSVFEMEELEEHGLSEHFISDEDASNEELTTRSIEDENLMTNLKNNVLKKRNSNIEEDLHALEKSGKISIAVKKYNNDLLNNKYSCSLPRDIPVMHCNRLIKNIVNQSSEDKNRADNENHYYPVSDEKFEHQKRPKFRNNMTEIKNSHSMYTSYKNQNDEESESSPINNDLYEGDDELFEDDHNNNLTKSDLLDEFDEQTDTTNMGQAISNLASSIVLKDGRELFGGVPSRRVPINSISKSCFE